MKINIELLEPDSFYHIFNKGINGENIFKEDRNYSYFLEKYSKYVSPSVDTYAYCLLKNHFHLLIKTKTSAEILDLYAQKPNKKEIAPPVSHIIGKQFGDFFNSYAQSINKASNRSGQLFEETFRRKIIETEDYFTEVIYYIHNNPVNHGFTHKLQDYKFSSYQSILSHLPTKLKRDEVINWFGNKEEFIKFHLGNQALGNLTKFEIE